ncbi:MAG: UDP-4-amino-4,6-dideoxy-N-acetyl-beta-L-altrosamine transaminase [candidate division KSB1 bacterium]|nr:UDP-4-amino-4,6-dideoxy-N-acetyl-beta-L-altrosamine transaminase [candidate division KSB1 bacterium]
MSRDWLPYGRHWLDEEDIAAVVEVLRHHHLTQGEKVAEFEQALAQYCGAKYAVAVANGTAALHCAALAAGFAPGEEVITSPLTFAASANCIVYLGGRPVFADIDAGTRNLDPAEVARRLTPKTRGLIPVHFAGRSCDMPVFAELARRHNLVVIEDAAHALGSEYEAGGTCLRVGACAHSDMTIFSFHPVKHVTTGEGGAILTNREDLYQRLLLLRSHGITKNPQLLERNEGPWYYEMQALGFNYRLSDIQCALGLSQLRKLSQFIARRAAIVARYNAAFGTHPALIPPQVPRALTAWHLYVLEFDLARLDCDRRTIFLELQQAGLGVQVHYIPVPLLPYYRRQFGTRPGDYPRAERYYSRALSLPLYPKLTDAEVERVIETVFTVVNRHCR